MVYSDSHVHLDSYPAEDLNIVFTQMKTQNVSLVLNVSINLEISEETIKIAGEHDEVFAAIGIHPGEAVPLTAEVKQRLNILSRQESVVALGEIGLDYGRPDANHEVQKELFAYQISLAKERKIPVDIHCSENAHQDIMRILHNENDPNLSGIVHGFMGGIAELNDWLELGFYISLGQTSVGTAKDHLHMMEPLTPEVMKVIPMEKLLTETDSMARMSVSRWSAMGLPKGAPPPKDMPAPPPAQEEFHQPADVVGVAERIASIMGFTPAEVGSIATANLKRILKLR